MGECKTQIFKAIRLTELVDALLDKVDIRGLAFSPAVELSYLSYDEQHIVAECMDRHEIKPSLSQAVRLKKLKHEGTLTAEAINGILSEEKRSAAPNPKEEKGLGRFRRFFPEDYTPSQMSDITAKLLSDWRAGVAV
jgi:ParB family chromosome partitioning protein